MNVTFRALLGTMASIARLIGAWLIAAWAMLTAAASLADLTVPEAGIASLAIFAVSILQLVLTVAIMRRGLTAAGIERDGGAGVGGLFLISIPLNLGIGLGFLLLVLPGLYLAARWRLAVPNLLATDDGFDSMRFSWERTAPHWRPLMLASLLPAVPFVVAITVLIAAGEGAVPVSLSIASNAALYAGIVLGWLLDLAAYRLIVRPTDELAETFA